MANKNMYSIFFIAVLFVAAIVISGCSENEQADTDNLGLIDDTEEEQNLTMVASGRTSDSVGTTQLDSPLERYLSYSVDLTCLMFSGQDIMMMEENELDQFAQRYGFSSASEAERFGESNSEVNSEEYMRKYTENLNRECPEAVEAMLAMGQYFEETMG